MKKNDNLIEIEKLKNRIAELKKSEGQYRGIFENICDGMIFVDVENKVLSVNSAFCKICEIPKEEIEGKYILDFIKQFVQPNQFVSVSKIIDDMFISNNNLFNFDLIFNNKDLEISVRNVDSSQRVMIVRDISAKKKSDEEILKTRERLKSTNSILRHDIGNDLAVINSAVKIFQRTKNSEMLNEIRKRIKKSIKKIDLHRESEIFIELYPALSVFKLESVITAMITIHKDIVITISGRGNVYADKAIYFIFEEIINNAIIHGNAKNIDFIIDSRENLFLIKCVDNGIGISDAIRRKVFDKEFSYGKTGNTGMGLYNVKNFIESFGGTIFVEDNKSQGSTFVITFHRSE